MLYEAIVIGVSSGGLNALKTLFTALPAGFNMPLIVVQHISPRSDSQWIELMNQQTLIRIKEAEEKEFIEPGTAYIAPPNYHLLIEKNRTFTLTIDERVNFARPSIDVLFESAADAYKNKLIAIILTGANNDGARGMNYVYEKGGLTIVQTPDSAESSFMPQSALALTKPDYVLPLPEIPDVLISLHLQNNNTL